jgi:hypothetical protein
MIKIAYLTGYTGKPTRSPAQLLQLAINLGAVVVDSRYNPQSRVPHWNGTALARLMGRKYLHIRDFGQPSIQGRLYKDCRSCQWPRPTQQPHRRHIHHPLCMF